MPDEVMPYRFSGRTQLAEVSPGVSALDLPTPLAIGSTNSYIFKADGIHDNGRSLIVDTGCNSSLTKETFETPLRNCILLGKTWMFSLLIFTGITVLDSIKFGSQE